MADQAAGGSVRGGSAADGTGGSRSAAPERTPVTLVTGFLGSGKTTLINAALRAERLDRTVVVVNEFGEIPLDHALLATSNDEVVVLANGCLCCTVRSDLVGTLNELHQMRRARPDRGFDRVVIETSGLAEPGPILQAFLSEPTLDGIYRVGSVLTVVDAVNWDATLAAHDEALRQVAFADRLLLGKLDLAPAGAAERLAASVARFNPTAEIMPVPTEGAALAELLRRDMFDPADPAADPRPWLAAAAHAAHAGAAAHAHEDHDHDHDHDADGGCLPHHGLKGVVSFVLTREEPLTREELQFLLEGITQNLGPSLLRVKGLVNIAEEPGRPAVIQGAQHLLHTMTWLARWPDADARTRIVFITQGVERAELEEMMTLLDRISARTFQLRNRARQGART